MSDQEMIARMLKLLPHWAEHTDEHVVELKRWRTDAENAMDETVIAHLTDAENRMRAAGDALVKAHDVLKQQIATPATNTNKT